jgi:mannose-6-phosphate isomerase-like protein (cupin superfamily)
MVSESILQQGKPSIIQHHILFMWVIEGEIEFLFGDDKKSVVKSGECFVLPKHLRYQCIFKKLTIAIEGVCEKEL